MKRRIPKKIMEMENIFALYSSARHVAIEIDALQRVSRLNKSRACGLAVTHSGGDMLVDIDIHPKEYAAIRRYLLRNRKKQLSEIYEGKPQG